MIVTALPKKVRMTPIESQAKTNFLAGLKSRTSCFRFLADGEMFLGKGLPPGPGWSGTGSTTSSLEAVNTLWIVNARRNKRSRTIGYA